MKSKIIPAATALVAALTLTSGALASGGDDDIRSAGTCTDSSSSKIKVKPDDGRIEVEFEVDQNQTGDTWKVKIKDNGATAFSGKATTRGPSGSFEIERKIADQSGSDAITATAKNKSGGERCSASATI
jgi:osmotically-inducible protein OsmY